MSVIDELFEETKQGIKEILQSDLAKKIRKYSYNGIDYKFTNETIADMLPNLQAINSGLITEVIVHDVDGNEFVMSAEDYVKRNNEGFINQMLHNIDFEKLIKILETIQTFTALANFGSFDMAKDFYLRAEKQEKEETEDAEN